MRDVENAQNAKYQCQADAHNEYQRRIGDAVEHGYQQELRCHDALTKVQGGVIATLRVTVTSRACKLGLAC